MKKKKTSLEEGLGWKSKHVWRERREFRESIGKEAADTGMSGGSGENTGTELERLFLVSGQNGLDTPQPWSLGKLTSWA